MTDGNTLKLIRQWKNISQLELADKLKSSQQYISELESKEYFNGTLKGNILRLLKISQEEWDRFKKLPPPSTKEGD